MRSSSGTPWRGGGSEAAPSRRSGHHMVRRIRVQIGGVYCRGVSLRPARVMRHRVYGGISGYAGTPSILI